MCLPHHTALPGSPCSTSDTQCHLQAQADLEALRASGSQQQPQLSTLNPNSEAAALQARNPANSAMLCALLLLPATPVSKSLCAQVRVTQLAVSALSSFVSRVAATAYNMTPASAQMGTAATLQVPHPPLTQSVSHVLHGDGSCKPWHPESDVAHCIISITSWPIVRLVDHSVHSTPICHLALPRYKSVQRTLFNGCWVQGIFQTYSRRAATPLEAEGCSDMCYVILELIMVFNADCEDQAVQAAIAEVVRSPRSI